MNEALEYPLPVLSVSVNELVIETKDVHTGLFKIKNTGGSTLSGRIVSRTRSVAFEPSEWTGNEATILYRFTPDPADGWKPGDAVSSCAIISSNGGEKKLPVSIRLTKMAIATEENVTIANITDFYNYSLQYPAQARKLFTDSEFYMLLLATGYAYIEAYEVLHKDLNRERAMDNFFVLSGLKRKTALTLPRRYIEFVRRPRDTDVVYGNLIVQKSDDGFVEAPIRAENNAPWLMLPAERLITSDFNEAGSAMVRFSIDPLRIKGRFAREIIAVGADGANRAELVYRRLQPVEVRLNREAFRFDDRGVIEMTNNTGAEILVELFCDENFVRFASRGYTVRERAEIPFDIRLSAFMSAQLVFRKLPFLRAGIEVRAHWRDTVLRRKLPLTVGKWL